MVHIPEFRAKWGAYRTRAHLISPHFPAEERVTHDSVARRIPHDPTAPVPATEGKGIAPQAFGYWLSGHVHQPSGTLLGTRFDVLVLVLNLSGQPDEIRTLFDALERRWLVSAREVVAPPHQKMVRATLDEAASLIEAHDVRNAMYLQKCEVVDRTTALGLAHG